MGEPQHDARMADIVATYRDTIQPLYQFVARRAGRSRQLAEDITQETYLRAVAQWRTRRRPRNALAWLQTVARHLLLNHYRRRRPESLEASGGEGVLEAAPVDGPDAATLVYWGLARLRRRPRQLLEAFYIDGKSVSAIATDLGVSERAVEGRLRRARQALEDRLTPIVRDQEGIP
ncbi:MAG TPA: RNA polymerase sigma factor [Phycisphaerae bacterium]|nr:RNA polymerase sigma factor [Phycisphaerae bacterium]HNU47023.1 RNA polymerase sigma factor [Phycisphaerae bacterium]